MDDLTENSPPSRLARLLTSALPVVVRHWVICLLTFVMALSALGTWSALVRLSPIDGIGSRAQAAVEQNITEQVIFLGGLVGIDVLTSALEGGEYDSGGASLGGLRNGFEPIEEIVEQSIDLMELSVGVTIAINIIFRLTAAISLDWAVGGLALLALLTYLGAAVRSWRTLLPFALVLVVYVAYPFALVSYGNITNLYNQDGELNAAIAEVTTFRDPLLVEPDSSNNEAAAAGTFLQSFVTGVRDRVDQTKRTVNSLKFVSDPAGFAQNIQKVLELSTKAVMFYLVKVVLFALAHLAIIYVVGRRFLSGN